MRCSCHRAEKKCNAAIKVMPDGAVITRKEHAPGCMHWNGIDLSRVNGATILNDDVQDLLHQWVEKQAVSSDHSHQAPKVFGRTVLHIFVSTMARVFLVILVIKFPSLCTMLDKLHLDAMPWPRWNSCTPAARAKHFYNTVPFSPTSRGHNT